MMAGIGFLFIVAGVLVIIYAMQGEPVYAPGAFKKPPHPGEPGRKPGPNPGEPKMTTGG